MYKQNFAKKRITHMPAQPMLASHCHTSHATPISATPTHETPTDVRPAYVMHTHATMPLAGIPARPAHDVRVYTTSFFAIQAYARLGRAGPPQARSCQPSSARAPICYEKQ